MPKYNFRPAAEAFGYVLTAVGFELLQTYFVTFDLEGVSDWETWKRSLIGSAIRTAAGAILHLMGRQRPQA